MSVVSNANFMLLAIWTPRREGQQAGRFSPEMHEDHTQFWCKFYPIHWEIRRSLIIHLWSRRDLALFSRFPSELPIPTRSVSSQSPDWSHFLRIASSDCSTRSRTVRYQVLPCLSPPKPPKASTSRESGKVKVFFTEVAIYNADNQGLRLLGARLFYFGWGS